MSAVGDRARRHLHERLEATLGHEAADTLMEEIGSLGREQLASRHDVQLGFAEVRREFAVVRQEMAEFREELKTDMAELRTELKTDVADLRTEVKTDIAGLRAEMKADFVRVEGNFAALSHDIAKQTRQLGIWMAASQATLAGIVLAATRL